MRKYIVLLTLILSTEISAQSSVASYTPRMIAPGVLPPVETKEGFQSKYIKQEWSLGKVYLKNTDRTLKMQLIFDQFRNNLYFQENGNMMAFAEPIPEFSLEVNEGNETFTYVFRNGYPEIHRNTLNTYYQILTDGKFQLLRCKAHTIGAYKERELKSEDPDYSKQMFYAYLPNNKIVHIKADKESIAEAFSGYHAQLEKAGFNNMKIKNEKSLMELFVRLNETMR